MSHLPLILERSRLNADPLCCIPQRSSSHPKRFAIKLSSMQGNFRSVTLLAFAPHLSGTSFVCCASTGLSASYCWTSPCLQLLLIYIRDLFGTMTTSKFRMIWFRPVPSQESQNIISYETLVSTCFDSVWKARYVGPGALISFYCQVLNLTNNAFHLELALG